MVDETATFRCLKENPPKWRQVKTQRIMITNNKGKGRLCEISKITPIYTHEAGELFLNARVLLNIVFQFKSNYFRQIQQNEKRWWWLALA